MPVSQWDKELGWVPAVPLPFWERSWKTLFRERPACYRCDSKPRVFKFWIFAVTITKASKPLIFEKYKDWETHYVLTHLEDDERSRGVTAW